MTVSPAPEAAAGGGRHLGAYGIAMTGEALGADAHLWLPEVPEDWPVWEVLRESSDAHPRPEQESLDDDHSTLLMYGGAFCELDRLAQRITLFLPESEPVGGVLHPGATLPSMVIAHWRGALNFHAGAVLLHGRVWGVLGHKGAGKSTTLAALDRAGHPVLADDMLVFNGADVQIGPRFVDLRQGSAEHFPDAIDCGRMGMRQRFRLPLSPAPTSAPFAGWLLPNWGDEISVEPVPPLARLHTLSELLNIRLAPKDPVAMLDVTARPLLRVTRPRSFDALQDYLAAIEEATAGA